MQNFMVAALPLYHIFGESSGAPSFSKDSHLTPITHETISSEEIYKRPLHHRAAHFSAYLISFARFSLRGSRSKNSHMYAHIMNTLT